MENDRLIKTDMDLPQRVKALLFDKDDAIDVESRYQFVRRLGRGAMGKVFLFRDVRLNKDRALKTVDEILTQFPAAVEGLKRECEIMQDLTHPNIVAVRDLVMDQWGYRYYIVMDYADGITLYEYLSKNKKPGKAIACEIIEKLASALDFAHGMGLLHRDVKTDNVMVTFDGEKIKSVKLLDFGIGRKVNEILMATTGGSAGGGAPAYRSPEGWKPRQYGKVSARSDQYSLAVMAYEMLAGRRPYWEIEADDDVLRGAVLDKDEIPERIDSVEDYVNDALLKALSKRPEDRFESCGAFAKALTTAPAAPKTVTVEPPAATPAIVKTPPPQPVVVADPPLQPKPAVVTPRPAAQSVAEGDMTLILPGNVPLELVHIPHGTFMMGSPASEPGRHDDEVQHRVTLTKDYWLGKYPVTQGQWKAVMGTTLLDQANKAQPNKRVIKIGNIDDEYPMYWVNWNEALEFCLALTKSEQTDGSLPAGYEYTLPTEAQWEYACRSGTSTALYSGDIVILGKGNAPALDGIAWYGGNSSVGYEGQGWDTKDWKKKQYPGGLAGPRKVGGKQANAWGLFDMIGNVYEWCRDKCDIRMRLFNHNKIETDTYQDGVWDPCCRVGSNRVLRGGSWRAYARVCRSAVRYYNVPAYRDDNVGFRVALASVP